MFRSTVLVLFASILVSPAVIAKSRPGVDAVEIDTYENFQEAVTDIRSEMTIGGRYEFLRGMDRDSVNEMLDAMAGALRSSGSVADLPADARSSLMAEQEAVNELLTKFADNRLICTHEAPIGSLIPRKRCRTLRQIERTRSKSKTSMMDMQKDADSGE